MPVPVAYPNAAAAAALRSGESCCPACPACPGLSTPQLRWLALQYASPGGRSSMPALCSTADAADAAEETGCPIHHQRRAIAQD